MLKGAGHKNPWQSLFLRSQIIWKREHSSPWLDVPALMAVDSKAAWHKSIGLHMKKYIFTFHSKFTLTIKAFLSKYIHNYYHLYFVKQAAAHRRSKRWSFISQNYLEIQLNTSRVPLKMNNTWFWMPPVLLKLEYGIWIIYVPADFPDYIFNRHRERLTNCYSQFQIWNNDLESTSSFLQSFKVFYSPPTQSGEVLFPFLKTSSICSNWAWLWNVRSVWIVTIAHTNWRQHREDRITKNPEHIEHIPAVSNIPCCQAVPFQCRCVSPSCPSTFIHNAK